MLISDGRNSYSLKDGASFDEQARGATFDLVGDEGLTDRQRHNSQLKWDRKKKKFVRGDGVGADNVKLVRTESGARLPATYRSGRFDEWRSKMRVNMPKIGEAELEGTARRGNGNKRFKHQSMTAAKPLDKLSNDYERKMRHLKKREQGNDAGTNRQESSTSTTKKEKTGKRGASRYGGKPIGKVKGELKSVHQIRKARELADRKRARNARPTRKKGKN